MNRQEISAFLANCKVSEFMAYADLGESGTVVVRPDGRKYRYSVHDLEAAELKAEATALQSELRGELRKLAEPSKPKPKRTTKPKAATRKKPAEKKSTKSATKPATKPTTEPPTKTTTKPTTKSGTKPL